MNREATRQTTFFETGFETDSRDQAGPTADDSVEPGKDHYVRSGGKLIGILLASLYPTEWHLEQARRDYERGVEGPVEISSRRSGKGSTPDEGVDS